MFLLSKKELMNLSALSSSFMAPFIRTNGYDSQKILLWPTRESFIRGCMIKLSSLWLEAAYVCQPLGAILALAESTGLAWPATSPLSTMQLKGGFSLSIFLQKNSNISNLKEWKLATWTVLQSTMRIKFCTWLTRDLSASNFHPRSSCWAKPTEKSSSMI